MTMMMTTTTSWRVQNEMNVLQMMYCAPPRSYDLMAG